MRSTKRDLERLFRKLRRRFPTRERVHLRIFRFKKGADCFGGCLYDPEREEFLIELDSRVLRGPLGRSVEVLLHEYAHALAWTTPDHGNRWALAYGRLYRWHFDTA
jgi:hypothetical protein